MSIYRFPVRYILLFILLTLLLVAAGYLYYGGEKQEIQQRKHDEIAAITNLKVLRIAYWRETKINEAVSIFKNPFTLDELISFINNPQSSNRKNNILEWFGALDTIYEYNNIFLTNTGGNLILSKDPNRKELLVEEKPFILEAKENRNVILSPLHRDIKNIIHIDLQNPS